MLTDFGFSFENFSAQPGYAAVPTAAGNINAAYAARPGYDQAAYQAAATQGTYASKNWFHFDFCF